MRNASLKVKNKKMRSHRQISLKTQELEKEIKEIVSKVARVDESGIKNDTKIRDELGLDSLNAMEILAAIEVRFGITIDEAKVFDVITFKDLSNLVKSYLFNR